MTDIPGYTPPQEALPVYAPTIETFGLALLKTEFHSPYQFNTPGSAWAPVLLELNSTQLNIYSLGVAKDVQKVLAALILVSNRVDLADDDDQDDLDAYGGQKSKKSLKESLADYKIAKSIKALPRHYDAIKDNRMLLEPIGDRAQFDRFVAQNGCQLLHTFTLNRLHLGTAPIANTNTFRNCLRLRIELKQLLLQFWSFSAVVDWFKDLHTGKGLAANYESRVPNRAKTIPQYSTWSSLYTENNISDVFSDASTDSAKSTTSKSSQESLVSLLEVYPLVNRSQLIPVHERRFIQSCMPVLNSYDKWNGMSLTLSHFDTFVVDPKPDSDLFISENDVKKRSAKTIKSPGQCRDFLIHKEGLISVVS